MKVPEEKRPQWAVTATKPPPAQEVPRPLPPKEVVDHKTFKTALQKRRNASKRAAEARFAMHTMRRRSKWFSLWAGTIKGRKAGEKTLQQSEVEALNKRLVVARRTADQAFAMHARHANERGFLAWSLALQDIKEERKRAEEMAKDRESKLELARNTAESRF